MTDHAAERAGNYLEYLIREWEGVPEMADEWPNLDALGKEVVTLDWNVPQDRLVQVRRWAARGVLTREQMERYRELLTLIERHRPTLERLFEEGEPAEHREAS